MTSTVSSHANKTTARIVGALFLTATSMYILGGGLVDPLLAGPDFLQQIDAHRGRVVTGVVLQFLTAAANVLIGVLLFTLLKRYSETIALGYAVTRTIDGIGVLLAGAGTLSLLALSQQALQVGAADASALQALGTFVVAQSAMIFDVTMIALGVGGMPFCYLLYRARLVPRTLAALGFVGYAALLAGGVVELYGLDLAMIHYLPGGVFELVLPLWLFVKGFDTTAAPAASGAARATVRRSAAAATRA